MNLKKLQDEVSMWSRMNFQDQPSYRPLLGIAEEVGELCHAHLKAEQDIRGSEQSHFDAKCDAVGDIIIYLADYCSREGIDLEMALTLTWDSVKERDWIKNKENGK